MGVASNARWIAASQAGRVATQLIGVAILARLLAPHDYGVIAMATVVTTLAGMLRDMGTGSAVVQRPELTDSTINAVFWFNLLMGCCIAMATAAGAGFIALGFRERALEPVLWFISLAFPVAALATAHQSLLERRSEFAVLARIELVSSVLALFLAVAAAIAGAGVYSLVVQTLASALLSTGQLWFASGWRPSKRPRWSDLRELMHFSGNLAGFNLINFVSRNADSVVIGRLLGASALGGYSVAYKLMLFPLQNLTFVASRALYPVMSRRQDDLAYLAELYLRSVRVIAMLTAPLMAGAFVLREPLVGYLFGNHWPDSAAILAWLAPTGFIQSIVSTTGTVFMARGRTDVLLRLGIMGALLQVGAFLLGAQYGVVEVALFYCVANIVNAAPCLYVAMRQLDSRFLLLLRQLVPSICSALVLVIALFALRGVNASWLHTTVIGFLANVLIGAGVYLICLVFVFRQSLYDVVRLVRPSS